MQRGKKSNFDDINRKCSISRYRVMRANSRNKKRSLSKKHPTYGPYEKYFKRLIDCTLAFIALVMLTPALVVIAVLVWIKIGTPILFIQRRPGINEKLFKLYKFRTMNDKRGKDGKLLPDSERLTSFGQKLRYTSLDELPELLNIIKGDMALVGPRPLLISYLPYYTNEERQRHSVRPGLTGLAQIHGRNNLGWTERLAYDIKYVNKITLLNDCKIIFSTIKKVLKHNDVVSDGNYIMQNLDDERKM